jgi:IS605 OrfB family transposase
MEYAVQSNVIRGLTKEQYQILRELCQYSNNLYNVALYNIRQYFFNQNKFLTYESNYHECKDNENYGLLQAGVAQQTLKVVDRSFKSFFNLLKKCRQGEYRYNDVKIPHYRKKGGLFNLVLSTNAISIKDGYFKIPMSREYRKLKDFHSDIKIPFPSRLVGKVIKEVRILPVNDGKYFKVQYVYVVKQELQTLDTGKVMAIDIGVENLATCVSNVRTPFIMDGRRIKSINQYWNKQAAYYKSVAMKQQKTSKVTTRRLQGLAAKRNNQVDDYIKKTTRYIINQCLEYQIGTLIVGYNKDFKRSVNLGTQNNQNFVQLPTGKLRQQLEFLCWKYGINYLEVEESYTSKSSFLDNDELPEYKAEQPYTMPFSGRRIKRGLYQTKDGRLINADVNGAYNILRKGKQDFTCEELSSGLLESPLRIRIA